MSKLVLIFRILSLREFSVEEVILYSKRHQKAMKWSTVLGRAPRQLERENVELEKFADAAQRCVEPPSRLVQFSFSRERVNIES
jgi:hypothetical protein